MPAILQTRHWTAIKKYLKGITSLYWLQILRDIQNENFGVPQVRRRVYFVFILKHAVTGDPRGSVERITKACYVDEHVPFYVFFEQKGCPLVPTPAARPPGREPCTCSPKKVCHIHCCKCRQCLVLGRQTTKCAWRAGIKRWQQKTVSKRRLYVAAWRKVRKDQNLKNAPTIFELAEFNGLGLLTLPLTARERVTLQALSSIQNLSQKEALVDLSQSIDRSAWRTDGLAPTLGCGCTRILAPHFGVFLSAKHCLWLQGFNPQELKLNGLSPDSICKLAGNAMCLPAVTTIALAALSLVKKP